jgi:uncharacterized protein YecE (DUF72 family)
MSARAYIGTSGWNYPTWREACYGGRPQREWLACCAERFNAVEVNATFHRLQRRETFARWRAQTPAGFRFTMKANRYLTHNKKLGEAPASIRLERERAAGLGFDNDAEGCAPRNARRLAQLVRRTARAADGSTD